MTTTKRPRQDRDAVLAGIGRELPLFQNATDAVDEAAAAVLALNRADLRCLDLLRHGPMSVRQLAAALGASERAQWSMVRRLELAGYARPVPDPDASRGAQIELTEHAQEWIESLWGPLRDAGLALFAEYTSSELAMILRFIAQTRAIQEAHAARLRALAETPASERPRANRARGGLSPAALRRVHLFVQAHIDRPLRLADLASRAQLSPYHFARAFKASTGETPRAFIERLRIERAERLLRETELPLAEVALASGFSTQSRLTTAFRLVTGFTPARYRRGIGRYRAAIGRPSGGHRAETSR